MIFTNRVALVTGGTKGIGLAIATDLARQGASVRLNYRSDAEQAKEALGQVREAGGEADLLQADVADPGDVDRMFREVREDHGRLDLFVNNAGVTADGHALMLGEAKWRRVLETNLTGAFLCCRAAGRLMVRRRSGAIVAVASTSGVAPPEGQANYAASKAGLLALVRVLAKELSAYGVRVNAVLPGFVDTPMTQAMPRQRLQAYVDQIPLGRVAEAGQIAPAVRFLLSDDASYITGASLVVDGGLTT